MKKNIAIYLFFLVLAGDLIAIYFDNRDLQYAFKPLIILTLILHLALQRGFSSNKLLRWIMIGLIFSWIGDVLLMFDDCDPIFFILGLLSFLLAHLFYIIFFHRVRVIENIKSNPWMLAAVVLYYAILIYFLSPFLGDMKLPVRIYGVVISFMLMLALHMLYIQNRRAGRTMLLGAILFVVSDSVLAFNKFYEPIQYGGLIIMTTYGIAQLLIVVGSVKMSGNGKNGVGGRVENHEK